MITLHDCIAFSGLDTDSIRAVALHHHLPDVIAAQYAAAQLETPTGAADLARIVERALARQQP